MTIYAHDRIVFLGGAESVLQTLMKHFGVDEKSKVYVLYSTHTHFAVGGRQVPIVTALPGRMNRCFAKGSQSGFFLFRWLFDYRNLMFFYPLLCRLLSKKIQAVNADHLVISSFAAIKNIVPSPGWSIHTRLYLHSPMQYIRENYDEYMGKLTGVKKALFAFSARYLRPRDKQVRHYDVIYTNSLYTAQCAEKYYRIKNSLVRYPPLHGLFLSTPAVTAPRDYFVYVGRLVRFIREVDVVINLCNELHIPLLVIGSGPDEGFLKSIAGPTITFVGQINDVSERSEIVKYARGCINLTKESCGMATMEALCLGVPVFGYDAGGTRELVGLGRGSIGGGKNCFVSELGVLASQKSLDVLIPAVQLFLTTKRDRLNIQQRAHKKIASHAIP